MKTHQLNIRTKPEAATFLKQVSALANITQQDIVEAALMAWYGMDNKEVKLIQKKCLEVVKKHRLNVPFDPTTTAEQNALKGGATLTRLEIGEQDIQIQRAVSSVGERLLDTEKVEGSIPSPRTNLRRIDVNGGRGVKRPDVSGIARAGGITSRANQGTHRTSKGPDSIKTDAGRGLRLERPDFNQVSYREAA